MKKYLTNPVMYTLYGVAVFLLVIGLFVMGRNTPTETLSEPFHAYNILDYINLPVVGGVSSTPLGRPYSDANVTIAQYYYDYRSSSEEQQKSIIYYEDTYLQSTGISYSLGGEEFDAIAVLDGEVIDVKEDSLLGNSVTIKHSSNITTIYQSIADIKVKKGDTVQKGMIIGKSGESNINKDLGNHLYFELIVDNISVNPEEYYDKTL